MKGDTMVLDKMYYTVNEVAELFKLKPVTIRSWITRGKLKKTQLNKWTVRIHKDEVIRLMNGE